MVILFIILIVVGVIAQLLDWLKSVHLFNQYGPKGELNPIIKFFMSKSKWLALGWKLWPSALLVWAAMIHTRDVQNFGVPFGDDPAHNDHFALAWIAVAALIAAVGLFGFLRSRGVKD